MTGTLLPINADIPLIHAMLAWTPAKHGAAVSVVRWPDIGNTAGALFRSDCACCEGWREANHDWRMAWLMRVVWQATVRDGIAIQDMHTALLVIPEFRAGMTVDMLPKELRAIRPRWPKGTRVKINALGWKRHGCNGTLAFGTDDLGDGGVVRFDDDAIGTFGPGELVEDR